MVIRGYSFAHEHAGTRRGLEDVIDTLHFQRGAFLIRASADLGRDVFSAGCGDVIIDVGGVGRWSKVRFAADEEDRN